MANESVQQEPVSAAMKGLMIGVGVGAVAVFILGFMVAGWTTASSAEEMAKERAHDAVVTALAPICADKFQSDANSAAKLVELKAIAPDEQASFIQKGGWANLPGEASADPDVAKACASLLETPKS